MTLTRLPPQAAAAVFASISHRHVEWNRLGNFPNIRAKHDLAAGGCLPCRVDTDPERTPYVRDHRSSANRRKLYMQRMSKRPATHCIKTCRFLVPEL